MNKTGPKHYTHSKIEPADVIETFAAHDGHLSQALKYALRAGHKPESSYNRDLENSIWWLVRAIRYHGGSVEFLRDMIPRRRTRSKIKSGKRPKAKPKIGFKGKRGG